MRVVIAGCGRVGGTLAGWLAEDGHDVTVIDNRPAALESLGKAFNGAVVEGQAYDVETLRRAHIDLADVFVAVTDSDNANLMAVEVAKVVFGIKRSIARLYDPAREPSYRALDIRHVTGTRLIAQVVYEQVVSEDFHSHVPFDDSEVEIVEFTLNEAAAGVTIEDLEIRDRLRVASVHRGDHSLIPGPHFAFRPGDLVVAAAREGVRSRIRRYLSSGED